MKKGLNIRRVLEIGGLVAGVVLVAFGIAALVMGASGRSTVQSNLKQEYIFGSDDMTPQGIAPGVQEILVSQKKIAAAQVKAGVPASDRFAFRDVSAPSCSVAGQAVDSGSRARCFAQYMRIHALESSGGLTYSQMGRFLAKPNTPAKSTDFAGGTSDPKYALTDPKTKQPVSNGARNTWVTETALTSALNLAYTAEQISLFGIVVGVALLLSGIGFLILAVAAFHRRMPATAKEKAETLIPAPGGPKV